MWTSTAEPGRRRSPAQSEWLERADTLFVASSHPTGGADVSHRGGRPGFVRVTDPTTIRIPDYAGNNVFNTLGNLVANPSAGLLFVDFESGRTLQLTGSATVHWDEVSLAPFPGAARVVALEVAAVLKADGFPLRGPLLEYSPFLPTIGSNPSPG